MVLRTLLDAMREGDGNPVVFQYLVHARLPYEDRPDDCLAGISPDYVAFKGPLALDSEVWLTALGVERADPGAPEIHRGFVPALRELVDFFGRQRPRSPGKATPVVARAAELAFSAELSPIELRIVGWLLEEEGIGTLQRSGDPASPWSIELDLRILRYRRVATFGDYVRISNG